MAERPADIREHIRVLSEFEKDYRLYVFALDSERRTGQPYWHPQAHAEKRAALLRRAPRAARAMKASGVRPTMTPPPIIGGPALTDFVRQTMAHETLTYSGGPEPLAAPHMVLDSIMFALGALDDQLAEARQEGESRSWRSRAATVNTSGSTRPSQTSPGHVQGSSGEPNIDQVDDEQAQHRRWPTLVGRLKHVPRGLGIIADVGGTAVVIAFVGRALGAW